ncbi:MAG: DUF1080 domain-containing protein [Planctomycetales bacterium]|nr:DUF1080 domain-containing protein [Planctomycetales bacterium]
MRICFACVVLLLSCLGLGQVVSGQTVADSLSKVDQDFSLTGEYTCLARMNHSGNQGLQVLALGDGEFQGMWYQGGLPGNGWNQSTRTVMVGQRNGDSLVLTGELNSIVVYRGLATVYDLNGVVQSHLQKVIRKSPTLNLPPPANADVLFDGTHTGNFKDGKLSEEGFLIAGTEFIPLYKDFQLHIEFKTPYMPYARSQNRGNSGVYLLSRYEVQVLDSFGLEGVFNECGSLYRTQPPAQNMAFPPLTWQTYDITFHSPEFDTSGQKIKNARITVLHNGVPVHDNYEIPNKTGAGKPEGTELFPIKLQEHGAPVHYRNIWIVNLDQPMLLNQPVCLP